MAFEIGTAIDTFDLFDKLTAFMTRVSGWQMWSNIDGYGRRDFIYRSVGSSGNNDIYIRQRVGDIERFVKGADQYDYGNGDTGYLNFFGYLTYPLNGDAYAGASEIGSFGPRMYCYDANTSSLKWWRQDFLSQIDGGSTHITLGTPLSETESSDGDVDTITEENRRWHEITQGSTGTVNTVFTTDNKSNIYFANGSSVYRYSLSRGGGIFNTDGSVGSAELISSYGWSSVSYLTWYEDRTTRTPYLFVMGADATQAVKINLLTEAETSITSPPWPGRSCDDGIDSTQQVAQASCWDGGRFIYVLRGGDGVTGGGGYATSFPDWGRYDVLLDSWVTTEVPENPSFTSLPMDSGNGLDTADYFLTFVNKDISGFSYNRLYMGFDDELWFVDLDIDGMPSVANPDWRQQGYISEDFKARGELFYTRHNRMFSVPAFTQGAVTGIYERFPQLQSRIAMYVDLDNPGDDITLSWKPVDLAYFPTSSTLYGRRELVDGYACRVRATIEGDTEYVFIGNIDRIIVATKSSPTRGGSPSEWSVAYMGAFESYYDDTPYAELVENVSSGVFKKLKLTNINGSFIENSKYVICGTNGPIVDITYKPDGRQSKIGNSELITAAVVADDYIVATLKNNYSAGAKIGIDPNPVGVFLCEQEKFQTTNVAARLSGDTNCSNDASRQTYSLPISENNVRLNAGYSVTANTDVQVEPMLLTNGVEAEGTWNAREIRGKMKGVYAIGKDDGIIPGEIVALSDGGYIIIDIPTYTNKHLLIGPLL